MFLSLCSIFLLDNETLKLPRLLYKTSILVSHLFIHTEEEIKCLSNFVGQDFVITQGMRGRLDSTWCDPYAGFDTVLVHGFTRHISTLLPCTV